MNNGSRLVHYCEVAWNMMWYPTTGEPVLLSSLDVPHLLSIARLAYEHKLHHMTVEAQDRLYRIIISNLHHNRASSRSLVTEQTTEPVDELDIIFA